MYQGNVILTICPFFVCTPIRLLFYQLPNFLYFIKVKNTGDAEESLGGFSLKSISEGMFDFSINVSIFNTIFCLGLETVYKFHRTVKVPAGGIVAVWSSDAGEEHVPSEGQLVMKEGAWKFGDVVETVLVDKEGEVLASRDTKKVTEARGSSRRFTGRRTGLEAGADGDKNCSIM